MINIDREEVFTVEGIKLTVNHTNGQFELSEDKLVIDLTTAVKDQREFLLAMSRMFEQAAYLAEEA